MLLKIIKTLFGGTDWLDKLKEAYALKLKAQTDEDKILAELAIAEAEIRLKNTENKGVQVAIAIGALATFLHYAAVIFVSTFPQIGWTVLALPSPMDAYEGQIILGLLGLSAISKIVK